MYFLTYRVSKQAVIWGSVGVGVFYALASIIFFFILTRTVGGVKVRHFYPIITGPNLALVQPLTILFHYIIYSQQDMTGTEEGKAKAQKNKRRGD